MYLSQVSEAQWLDGILWSRTDTERLIIKFQAFYLESNSGEHLTVKYLVSVMVVYELSLLTGAQNLKGKNSNNALLVKSNLYNS